MAWCGPDLTVVSVGPDAEGDSRLMCMGTTSSVFTCELNEAGRQEQLRTPVLMRHFGGAFSAVQVAFGDKHLAIVTACQKLFMGGSNMHGQIARDSRIMSCPGGPYKLRESQPRGLVESVACGAVHTLAVTVAGSVASVWGCGSNLELQLRNNRNDDRCYNFWMELDISKLRAAQTTPGAVRVAAGRDFSVVAVGDAVGAIGSGAPGARRAAGAGGSAGAAGGFVAAAALPWRGTAIKHLVAGDHHVMMACASERRLHVYGWGANDVRQLGFSALVNKVDTPTEIPFGCPQQEADTFPSMLSTFRGNSLIVAGGTVWSMGSHEADEFWPSREVPHFWDEEGHYSRQLDPQLFDGLPIAYAGAGPMHTVFVTACGELFMRGSQSAGPDNGIPTRVRHLKRGVKGLCDTNPLWKPARVPSELFGGLPVRLWGLPPMYKLAFLMGTHDRLGWHDAKLASGSCKRKGRTPGVPVPCGVSALDPMLLKMIIDFADALAPSVCIP
jgi:hypothetical protein